MSEAAPDFSWVKEMKPAFVELQKEAGHEVNLRRLQKQGGEPFDTINFRRTERDMYAGEVGRKGNDLIFHFFAYPQTGFPGSFRTKKGWEETMAAAFENVFKHLDKIEAVFTDELRSWAVKVRGYGDNPAADQLCEKLFKNLDDLLS